MLRSERRCTDAGKSSQCEQKSGGEESDVTGQGKSFGSVVGGFDRTARVRAAPPMVQSLPDGSECRVIAGLAIC